MSTTDEAPEESVDTENVGGLEELLPERLVPVWRRVERVQEFRETYGKRYTKVLEALVALGLTGGYLYWLSLYFGG